MILPQPPTPDPQKQSSIQDQGNPGLALLLDSSAGTSSAPEYALQIAGNRNWELRLLYIIDLDQFPESGNPVSMGRLLTEEHRRRARRLESFKEMIECKGIRVSVGEPLVVNLFQLEALLEEILRLEPDLLIVGRSSFSRSFLKTVVMRIPFPVLIVPETQPVRKPKSLLLYSDGRRLKESSLQPVLGFAAAMRQQISVLSIVKRRKFGIRKFQSYLPSSTAASLVNFYQHEGADSVVTIEKFVRKRSFDMLSVILRDHWWFRRLFYRWSFVDLAFGVDVPLLIFKGK